jgi:hypothetical protein
MEPNVRPTQNGARMSQGLRGVRARAREHKQERFTTLLHHVTAGLLRDSSYALKHKAAPGVDEMTWKEHETGLEESPVDLHSRVHRGAYRAQPAKRRCIPKANGKKRPFFALARCTAALEDKIVQQAVVKVLNEIYEEDFPLGFEHQHEAERYRRELKEHLCEYGLELNEDKTRLIRFGRLARLTKPEAFTFLGFQHICGRIGLGRFEVRRITDGKRRRCASVVNGGPPGRSWVPLWTTATVCSSSCKYGSVRAVAGNGHPYRDGSSRGRC